MGALLFLAKGLAIGFAIAAPVGPIGVLCIRRTFAEGRAAGLATGLGAATADACYGAVAGFGLTAVSSFLLGYQDLLRLGGGVFLCGLGLKTFLSRPAAAGARMPGKGLAQAYATTVMLTLTNPATILSFIAVFAGAGLGQQSAGTAEALAIVAGVFVGSAAWWLLLSALVSLLRERVSLGALAWVNRVSGAVITAFGVLALWSAARRVA